MRTKTLKLKRKVAKLKQQSFKHQLFALKQQVFISKYSKPILTALILLPLLAIALIQPKPVLGDPGTPSAADLVFHSNPASTIPECYGWSECFAFTIDTRLDTSGNITGSNTTFRIPTNSGMVGASTVHAYDWIVDWGDGNIETVSGTNSTTSFGVLHTYSTPGEYRITIRPNVTNELLTPNGWMNSFGFYNNTTGANAQGNRTLFRSINSPFTDNMRKGSLSTNQNYRFAYIFCGATNGLGIPAGLFDNINTSDGSLFQYTFSNTFYGYAQNSATATIPAGLFDSLDTSNGINFWAMFGETFRFYAQDSALATIPADLFNSLNTSKGLAFAYMFSEVFSSYGMYSTSTTATIPAGLFDSLDTSNGVHFNYMFNRAFGYYVRDSATATIPAGLFDSLDTSSGNNFQNMFSDTFNYYARYSTTGTVPSNLFDSINTSNGTNFTNMFLRTFDTYATHTVSFLIDGVIEDSLTQSFANLYSAKVGVTGAPSYSPAITAGNTIKPTYNNTARSISRPTGIYTSYDWYTTDGTPCTVASPTLDCGIQNSSTLVSFPNTTEWTPTTSTEKGNVVFYAYSLPDPLSITAISPNTGPIAGGTTITITGTGFDDDTTVELDGLLCTNLTLISTTELTCDTPSNTAGPVDVTISNILSSPTTLTDGFTYTTTPIPPQPPVIPTTPPINPPSGDIVIPGVPNSGVRRLW